MAVNTRNYRFILLLTRRLYYLSPRLRNITEAIGYGWGVLDEVKFFFSGETIGFVGPVFGLHLQLFVIYLILSSVVSYCLRSELYELSVERKNEYISQNG